MTRGEIAALIAKIAASEGTETASESTDRDRRLAGAIRDRVADPDISRRNVLREIEKLEDIEHMLNEGGKKQLRELKARAEREMRVGRLASSSDSDSSDSSDISMGDVANAYPSRKEELKRKKLLHDARSQSLVRLGRYFG
jgi:hypothetical protein